MCVCVYVVWDLMPEGHSSRIMIGKCCVAPLLGMTIPRGELQSLVILHRVLLVVLEAMPTRTRSVSCFTDSLCSIGAYNKLGGTLRPYFANRVAEVRQLRVQIGEITDCLVPIQHIAGSLNPADIGT